MEEFSDKIKKIFASPDENEKLGLSFGLFPIRIQEYKLDKEETVALIEISQEKTGVEF